jgi:hypothetical protein
MKVSEETEKHIPHHNVGNKLDTDETVSVDSLQEAQQLFKLATERLLDVNCWGKISGPLSATFILTDEGGRLINGPAQPGNHFKIDIPGPGPKSGRGYDWVKVEALDDERNPGGNEESLTLRVRPSPDPAKSGADTAHFFKDYATSSFRVERKGNKITASVHGRNEIPNTETDQTSDKIRNAVVGTGAVAGISSTQWKALVHGLLNPSEE